MVFTAQERKKDREKGRDVADAIRKAQKKINWPRRKKAEKSGRSFCETYFKIVFFNPFSEDQVKMLDAIVESIRYGESQAIAAERGGGKTSITKHVAGVYAICKGLVKFLVLTAANGKRAKKLLRQIKTIYRTNKKLIQDYPEICIPIRDIGGSPQRAAHQLYDDESTLFVWGAEEVIFPTIPGSKASGAVIEAYGIEAGLRGLGEGEKRPDLTVCDDLDTRESAKSLEQTQDRILTLEADIMGLGGPNKSMPVVLLCTIIRKGCLADQYTDPQLHPEFSPIRQKWIKQWPDNMDLWDRYVFLVDEAKREGDKYSRKAHRFYLANRKEMDAGAVVSNINRFDNQKLPGGSQKEVSSLQAAFNKMCGKNKKTAFMCEYQNEPPDDDIEDSGIDVLDVQKKLHGTPRGVIPDGCSKLSVGVDVGGRLLNWVVVGWSERGGEIVDYGVQEVHSPTGVRLTIADKGLQKQIEKAIYTALLEMRDLFAIGWPDVHGEIRHADLGAVDSGYMPTPVYEFCRVSGIKWRATKGFGSKGGQSKYRRPTKAGKALRIGHYWHGIMELYGGRNGWLYNVDADHWKKQVHDGFRLPITSSDSLSLYGNDPVIHQLFAHQIMAEEWIVEWVNGRFRERWAGPGGVSPKKNNHYLDAMALAKAASDMLGIRVFKTAPVIRQPRRVGRVGGQIRTKY